MSAATRRPGAATGAGDTAASFRENRRVLELYAEAIAGRHVELRTTDDLPDLSAHVRRDLPTSSARCVFLPATVDGLRDRRRELRGLQDRDPPPARVLGVRHLLVHARRAGSRPRIDDDAPTSDLAVFFDSFARPALARQLFSDPRGHPDRRASAAALPRHAPPVLSAARGVARAAARRSSCSAAIARDSRRWSSSA